jgi:hypothetical protein
MTESKIYGHDIIRAYELSWLNDQGKPQLAVLQLQYDIATEVIDTWQLKKHLESINNTVFSNIDVLKQKYANCNVTIIRQKDFAALQTFEMQPEIYQSYKLVSYGLRFICQVSGQPYIGTINLCLIKDSDYRQQNLSVALAALRNAEFEPRSYVAALYSNLSQDIKDNFLLSVHLNRRGGLSYQALRSNKAIDFSLFKLRSTLE